MIYGLIFDVDGVIADTETLNARASVLMFQELYGLAVKPEDFRPFVGTGDERYVEGVAEKYGLAIDVAKAVQRRAENFFKLLQEEPLPAVPGVHKLIAAAKHDPQARLAIATSGQKAKQFPVIQAAGFSLDSFDVIITGEDVTRKKPDPQIYLLTAERLGLPPASCVVFEDAPAGVTAAKRAGMACIAITTSVSRQELAEADIVVDSFTEIGLEDIRRLVKAHQEKL